MTKIRMRVVESGGCGSSETPRPMEDRFGKTFSGLCESNKVGGGSATPGEVHGRVLQTVRIVHRNAESLKDVEF